MRVIQGISFLAGGAGSGVETVVAGRQAVETTCARWVVPLAAANNTFLVLKIVPLGT